ncbi:hypothetical protein DICVIV_11145 [Dictyocaulus viviparus]|uniref:Sodium:neurotransmitter symporter family protein n=1 Tax=Dictyocaulus viviparus TaxID=29172 RepID=A0A0D8XE21_DICVI|nr:hypothetical protein DICVIV_11145 [Dictyocaulus viviparus]
MIGIIDIEYLQRYGRCEWMTSIEADVSEMPKEHSGWPTIEADTWWMSVALDKSASTKPNSTAADHSNDNTQKNFDRLSRIRYLGAAIALAFGSGDTYYLPHEVSHRGGTTFIIQFIICYFLAALPMLYLEIALGQFTSASPWYAYELICPGMAGIAGAFAFNIVLRIVVCAVWASHAFALFGVSLTGVFQTVPWDKCTDYTKCYNPRIADNCLFSSSNSTECAAFVRGLLHRRSDYIRDTSLVVYMRELIKEDKELDAENVFPHPCIILALIFVWFIATIERHVCDKLQSGMCSTCATAPDLSQK